MRIRICSGTLWPLGNSVYSTLVWNTDKPLMRWEHEPFLLFYRFIIKHNFKWRYIDRVACLIQKGILKGFSDQVLVIYIRGFLQKWMPHFFIFSKKYVGLDLLQSVTYLLFQKLHIFSKKLSCNLGLFKHTSQDLILFWLQDNLKSIFESR